MTYVATNLGFLAGGSTSQGFCISGDGRIVAGSADDGFGNTRAVFWDAANLVHSLPDNASAPFVSEVDAISADGTVMAGVGGAATHVSIWINNGGGYVQAPLAILSGPAEVHGMSSDGRWVVGAALTALSGGQPTAPVIWDGASPSTPPVLLPVPVGSSYEIGQAANCVNANGTVVFGSVCDSLGNFFPARWTRSGPGWLLALLEIPAGSTGDNAVTCCTPGGLIAGGIVSNAVAVLNACYWSGTVRADLAAPGSGTSVSGCDATGQVFSGIAGVDSAVWLAGAIETLPLISGGFPPVITYGVSASAAAISGTGIDALSNQTAVRWDGGAPTVPTNLTCGADTTTSITPTWVAAPGFAADTYTLLYRAVGAPDWIQIAGIIGTSVTISGLVAGTTYQWKVEGVNGGGGGGFSVVGSCATAAAPAPPNRGFLVCGNDWNISLPLTVIYGLDHLVGQTVVGLADGVPVGPLLVLPDGSVNLPFPASLVTLGLSFTVQLQTPYLDTGNPTVQGRRKDITAATVRVDASAAPMVGSNQPDGGSFTPTQVGPLWSNLQPAVTQDPQQHPGTYTNPAGQTVTLLFSGDFRATLQPGWDERGQIAVQQTLPVPLAVTALMPEALQGDLPEQGISPPQQGQGEQPGPGLWMLSSRGRR